MTQAFFSKKAGFFDRWAPNYDILLTTIFYQAIHKRLLEYVQLSQEAVVLDLGCGTGRLLHRLASQFPTLQGIGIDLSKEMLRQARRHNQYRDRLIYIHGNAENLPFADGQFDAVFNTISFCHYPNPEQVLSEVSRVLNREGRFYLADYTVTQQKLIPFSPGGLRFYSRQQREELGNKVGLQCLDHYHLLGPILLTIYSPEKPL